MIVGRDTAALDEPEICRACVETVAENCNDAVVAPLFWFAVGGPGRRSGSTRRSTRSTAWSATATTRYRRLGWASARLDDLANLVPARLTWLLIALAAALVGRATPSAAFRIGWRDGRKHPSPNAAWGEAAMAGALGVRLGGRDLRRRRRRQAPARRPRRADRPRHGPPGRPGDDGRLGARRGARLGRAGSGSCGRA